MSASTTPCRTTAQEVTARHVRDALRALGCGHGIYWAADITALPLRFVVSVARAHGMTDAAGDESDVPAVDHENSREER